MDKNSREATTVSLGNEEQFAIPSLSGQQSARKILSTCVYTLVNTFLPSPVSANNNILDKLT